jgi:hypothetical protein
MTARDVIAEAVGDGEGGPDEYWDNATAHLIVERLTAAGYAIVPVEPTHLIEEAIATALPRLNRDGTWTSKETRAWQSAVFTAQAEQKKRG